MSLRLGSPSIVTSLQGYNLSVAHLGKICRAGLEPYLSLAIARKLSNVAGVSTIRMVAMQQACEV